MRLRRTDAEKELLNIRMLNTSIASIRSELGDLQECCGGLRGVSYDSISVQTSSDGSPLESAYIHAERRMSQLERALAYQIDERSKLIDNIRNIKPPEYSQLLDLLFIQCKSPIVCADIMGYTSGYWWKVRRLALKEYEKTYMT